MKDTRTTYRIAGAILAGGKAHRMGGIAKGMLRPDGSLSLIERLVVHMMRSGVDEIILAANDECPYTRIGCVVVPDQRTDVGPLAGIEAALQYFAGTYDAVLCLPCDLPSVSSREIAALITAFADTGGPVAFAQTENSESHPLCAVIHTNLLDRVSAALDRDERSVHDLWLQLEGTAVHFDNPNAFVNLNSPNDLDAWLAGSPNGRHG
jgi:molybdopterin-guanine dinucleotide biosynthesis protein A